MPKIRTVEFSDVQSVIDAGPQEVSWVQEELSGVSFGDKRLDRRLIATAEKLAKSPLSPINEACGTWASTKASYRLFNNAKATPAAILKPHTNETVKRIAAYGGPVLVVQDTVFISYGKHPKTKGGSSDIRVGAFQGRGLRSARCQLAKAIGIVSHVGVSSAKTGLPPLSARVRPAAKKEASRGTLPRAS